MTEHSENLDQIFTALSAAQLEFPGVARTGTGKARGSSDYRYATLADNITACREALGAHGLGIQQSASPSEPGIVALRTTLTHSSGQWLSDLATVPYEVGSGSPTQAYGACLTYARRYGLASVLGLAWDEDRDGAPPVRAERNLQVQRPRPPSAANHAEPAPPKRAALPPSGIVRAASPPAPAPPPAEMECPFCERPESRCECHAVSNSVAPVANSVAPVANSAVSVAPVRTITGANHAARSPACGRCGMPTTASQITLSERNFGAALCPKCQRAATRLPA